MSSKKALQLCPHLIFVRPRFEVYKEVSNKIRNIFHRFTDLIEPLSLDEAYLDVTEDKVGLGSAIEVAKQIRLLIKEELQLTASAGISINKFVAKIASDINKPDGLTFIGPSKIEAFMESLPVEKFYGVGKVTAEKMRGMGLLTGADLKKLSIEEMSRHFGKVGLFYFKIVRGIDEREVEPNQETKSVGAEDTFPIDLTTAEEMEGELEKISYPVIKRLERNNLKGKTITVKIKYHDFKQITRSKTFALPLLSREEILTTAIMLLHSTDLTDKRVRLLGISMSNFEGNSSVQNVNEQLRLF
jgi:DNA polymerase IV